MINIKTITAKENPIRACVKDCLKIVLMDISIFEC